MEITFKTLGKQKFTLSIDRHEYVEDLIIEVGKTIGQENLYQLNEGSLVAEYSYKTIGQENLYQMNEASLVAEYSLSPVLPVIGMVTQYTG